MGKFKKTLNERVMCKDGFSFSCQAHEGAYSSPRENGAAHYESVEIGFPSSADRLIAEYAEMSDVDPRESVYPYVPSNLVYILIAKHGGIQSGQVPRGVPEYGVTHCKKDAETTSEPQ